MADSDWSGYNVTGLDSGSDSSGGSSKSAIGGAIGLAGLALGAFGSYEGTQAAKKSAAAGQEIAGLEQQVNDKRQLAMQIVARRQQMETVRQNQRAQSMAAAAATNQGAQFGSGAAGGQAGIQGASAGNLLATNQQLTLGNDIFGLDKSISQQRIIQSQAQSEQATASGVSSIGGTLLKAAPMLASLLAV